MKPSLELINPAAGDVKGHVGSFREDLNAIGLAGAGLMALLVLAAILNYLDRLAISQLGPTLLKELSLNRTEWGWINSAFSLVYIFTSFFGGMWIDRIGVRKGLAISVIIWALAAMGHASATGFWSLCGWRMLLALGEGPGTAAMVRAPAD